MKRFLAILLIGAGLAYLLWGATGVGVYVGTLLVWLLGVYCGYLGALQVQQQPDRLDAEQAQSIALAAARMALLQQDRRFS